MIMMPGDFSKAIRGLSKITPDIIIFDPPRGGLEDKESIIKLGAKKIIYISCNPSTLAKDLSYFKDFYYVNSITPLDMFPYTSHIETITLLTKK
jgi:23S rRNA (uracil1939-C5)-methyltransferase